MNKMKTAAKWAVLIADLILGITFVVLVISTLSNLSKSEIVQKEGTDEYIVKYLEREDYGNAAMSSRQMRLGEEIDAPMQEFYMVGSYADLMFWEKIYAESGSESTAEDCRKQCDEIRDSLSEYENVFEKIDHTLENATAKEGS
ncbi:MAG TPA: hypothetical protein DCG49_09145 [Ruminococcus sp.]|nr:hypothetical protein [Ruminococcus sp.]